MVRSPATAAGVAALALALTASAGDIPEAELVLDVVEAPAAGRVPEAAPVRFALMPKGLIYVGGSSGLARGRLEPEELKELDKRLERIRKLKDLGLQVVLGPGAKRYRLVLGGKRPVEIVATGEPGSAPPGLQPVSSLIADLARFDHPSLRPFQPETYVVSAREGRLPGGCRPWTLPVSLREAMLPARLLPASAVSDWPTGAAPAFACLGEERYVVTLRPLVPGERPQGP